MYPGGLGTVDAAMIALLVGFGTFRGSRHSRGTRLAGC